MLQISSCNRFIMNNEGSSPTVVPQSRRTPTPRSRGAGDALGRREGGGDHGTWLEILDGFPLLPPVSGLRGSWIRIPGVDTLGFNMAIPLGSQEEMDCVVAWGEITGTPRIKVYHPLGFSELFHLLPDEQAH